MRKVFFVLATMLRGAPCVPPLEIAFQLFCLILLDVSAHISRDASSRGENTPVFVPQWESLLRELCLNYVFIDHSLHPVDFKHTPVDPSSASNCLSNASLKFIFHRRVVSILFFNFPIIIMSIFILKNFVEN